jgi:hypothetical protein
MPWPEWFAAIATGLLTQVRLVANRRDFLLREVEFYLHCPGHQDPFTHSEPAQKTSGEIYLHRRGGGYRGGSFKGLDLTFGPVGVAGGILIRTLEDRASGEQTNGCSCCVDLLLRTCAKERVADLDAVLAGRSIWDPESPIHLVADRPPPGDPITITQTARVGLTLKRLKQHPEMPAYIMAGYRFLTDPRIRKGKVYTVLSLIQQGHSTADITEMTGTPRQHIERYRALRTQGGAPGSSEAWTPRAGSTDDICRLHGRCSATEHHADGRPWHGSL